MKLIPSNKYRFLSKSPSKPRPLKPVPCALPPKKPAPEDLELLHRARDLVIMKAKEYSAYPMNIVCYSRIPVADKARMDVWRVMIGEWGLKRSHVEKMFKRDVRSLRKSVIGV
jgi:hypothetical protein